jgi:HEAT repeat protein
MQISSPNLKRCLIAKSILLFVVGGLILCNACSALTSPAYADKAPTSTARLADIFIHDIRANHSNSFESLLTHWEVKYGTDAYPALTRIAETRSYEGTERYIAVMGMAKLGGTPAAPALIKYLKDPSWMVRNAALHALSALKNPKTSTSVLPLLKDPALVIRIAALDAADQLKPDGLQDACLDALKDPSNYYHGKAQWIPQRALGVLTRNTTDRAERKKVSLALISAARKPQDAALEPILLLTLEKISGRSLDKSKPLASALAKLESQL